MMYKNHQHLALLALRMIAASIFFVAGYLKFPFWKGTPPGMHMSSFLLFTTKLLAVVEPLGAIAIFFGFLTRIAAWGFIIIMLGAIYVSQIVYGIGFVTPTSSGWNMPLAVLGGCIILAAFGAGKWSIDHRMRNN